MYLNTFSWFAGNVGNYLVVLFFILLKAHFNFLVEKTGIFFLGAISIPF